MPEGNEPPFTVYAMGVREMLPLLADYYRRVVVVSTGKAASWVRRHIAIEIVLTIVTAVIMLVAGLPESGQAWWYLVAPFVAIGVTVVIAEIIYLVITPFRWDRTAQEFRDNWNPRDIDAESDAVDPFIHRGDDGRKFLVLPRLSLINRDAKRAAVLDVSLALTVKGAAYGLTLDLERVQPAGLPMAMNEYQVGGSFIGRQIRIPQEDRLYGFVCTNLPDFDMYPQSVDEIANIALEFHDPIVKSAQYASVVVWPPEWRKDA